MQIIKGYQNNDNLRSSFCKLARQMFEINFEEWYQLGLWGDDYIPYSVFVDGSIVANVSVNMITMILDGQLFRLIQIGTVMTLPEYRGRGYIRVLMLEIEKDFSCKTDGMYLFANKSVIGMYPKFGYKPYKEYQYILKGSQSVEPASDLVKINQQSDKDIQLLKTAVENRKVISRFQMIGNSGLQMFHLSSYLSDSIYFRSSDSGYVITQSEQDEVLIYDIFTEDSNCDISYVSSYTSTVNSKIKLGFVPIDYHKYECQEIIDEDTTLFAKGDFFDLFEQNKLMFPLLSRA